VSKYKPPKQVMKELGILLVLAIVAAIVLWSVGLAFGDIAPDWGDDGLPKTAEIRRSASISGDFTPVLGYQYPQIGSGTLSGWANGAA
jgi:hypothetical protein